MNSLQYVACAAASLLLWFPEAPQFCGAQESAPARIEFFESRIRPVLIERCYECHNSAHTAEADVALDFRDGIREASTNGTPVIPGKPDESLLLKVIRHEIDGLEMPDGGPKLDADVIADFEKWIAGGAADPRDAPPTREELAQVTSWEATLAARRRWWSLQPIENPQLPPVNDWSNHPIDRFVYRKLREHGLHPAAAADRRRLIRRLSFAITGLPPTVDEIDDFVTDDDPRAYQRLVERLLQSEHFGERWARHWMDWVRYADSHGSEGDPAIPHAYQYRDYLIRAFNGDVPYDQLLREHVAGDLLPDPRINEDLGINESAIGTAHWRLVFHGFAPTDALDEKVRFTDDQINVFGKAFLGLTISCARCHDHKFDAISQADYYALFGILGSCRPAMHDVNTLDRQMLHQNRLSELKRQLRHQIADSWLEQLDGLASRLTDSTSILAESIKAAEKPEQLLYMLAEVERQTSKGVDFADSWQQQLDAWDREQRAMRADHQHNNIGHWNLAQPDDYNRWFAYGNGMPDKPSVAGEFAVAVEGENVVAGIYPAGVYSHGLTTLHRGVLASPRIQLDDEYEVWFHIVGGGQSMVRYVVQNYPRDGTVYPINDIGSDRWYWHKYDMSYWTGDQVHLELATAKDAPLQVRDQDRSWFGVRQVLVRQAGEGPPHNREREFAKPLFAAAADLEPQSIDDVVQCYVVALRDSIEAWRDGHVSDSQALYLNAFLQDRLLPNTIDELPQVQHALQQYRETEVKIPRPTRVPGIVEADAFDQPLYERGDHRRPVETVARRFLEVLDDRAYQTKQSGRLELADNLLRYDNPLTARVIVNRIWHYLFGKGIVATPDNFGRLGAPPTHPNLLDFLATRMIKNGWSIKDTIRFIVNSQTWQLDSVPSSAALKQDPANQWLSHFSVRRLDAEAIRDSLIFVSGQLDPEMYGPSFPANGENRRRSVYVLSRRNSLDQFLHVFDAPIPFATVGRRNTTNVPAQSLTMLNDPLIGDLARQSAAKVRANGNLKSDAERIAHLFESGLGRPPSDSELDTLSNYVTTTRVEMTRSAQRRAQLEQSIDQRRQSKEQILSPAREQLINKLKASDRKSTGPSPIARWDFTQSLQDTIGELHGEAVGTAQLRDDGLALDGNGYVTTAPLQNSIREKTLEAWVQLANDQQRGGGVITIQDLEGNVFDSIVFGERIPRRWLAGSAFFRRTNDFGGSDETQAVNSPIHFAIVYDADGTIRGYRNGESYGQPYRKSELVTFEAGKSHVLFGMRHGNSPHPNRMLKGKIFEARLYDRALTGEEIAASAARKLFVRHSEVLAVLNDSEREKVKQLDDELTVLTQEQNEMGPPADGDEAWTRVAHAIFNLKEFIYIR